MTEYYGSPWRGGKTYTPEWRDGQPLTDAIRNLCVGSVLAFPAGQTPLGDVSADVDASVSPDILADLEACPFKPRSFDTVYCDPPYGMYWNDQTWVTDLWAVARKRLILQTPLCRIFLPRTSKRWVLVEPTSGSSCRWVASLQVFEPDGADLTGY